MSDLEKEVDHELELLSRGAAEIISREDLRAKLLKSKKTGKPLKIKLGLDPTAPHIHLGFAVVLRKLRQFQDLGHHVVMLIGDFTARVGDPSGVSESRKMLTPEEIEANARTYREQFSLILDPEKTIVDFNSRWLGAMSFADVIGLASKYTVARIMERDDFEKRFREHRPIHMHEMLYPLMQGYDSVALESDVELGGTDQKFNILVGRELQREYGQEPQVVFTNPILVGLDGVQKMSKSKNNYVGITEPPETMFGKLMRMPDEVMKDYYVLCTSVPLPEIEEMFSGGGHPMELKKRLAREIITIYHDANAAVAGQRSFESVTQGGLPADIKDVFLSRAEDLDAEGKMPVQKIVVKAGLAPSNRDAARLIEQGAVSLDGEKPTDPRARVAVADGAILRVGTRNFVRLRLV
ncbi:MAG: tyrosine--tRNA ligase [Armatimonadetes bacterium]|nr:tyrosine--tRNA ligase [Armatimonadota bacterium]